MLHIKCLLHENFSGFKGLIYMKEFYLYDGIQHAGFYSLPFY